MRTMKEGIGPRFNSSLRRGVLSLAAGLLLATFPVAAQPPLALDPTCTVTVGNQTAFVGDDGKFLLQNVALFQDLQTELIPELYRIRATCLRNGQMITGQSPYFTLSPGQTTIVTQVFPSDLDPIPVAIEISTSDSLVAPGTTSQLTVIAHYADGSTRDVTSRDAGTIFLSTNRDLLTVDQTGLITGTNAGTFPQMGMVSAINEGNTATVFITSAADSNDFDGDGMPNDYEDLYGFDKFSSFDAFQDPDNDGLANLQEFQKGTLPNNPDTDLDGILDGVDGDPLRPESEPPTVAILTPAEGSTLFSGQTVHFTVDARDDGRITSVEILVNGVSFATLTAPPYERLFNVPFAVSQLVLTARATDGAGRTGTSAALVLPVVADPLTTVQGTVQGTNGTPISGASVALRLHGLRGEFFDFAAPLSSLPDLTGLTPNATRLIPGLAFRNPGSTLSPDTFGLGFSPDYAGRFTGLLKIPFSSSYDIRLGADDGARLSINGIPSVEVVPNGGFREAARSVYLDAGIYPVQIDYFQSVADAEVEIEIHAGDGGVELTGDPLRGVASSGEPVLLLSPSPFVATTGADGSFSIPNVPTILGNVGAGVAVSIDSVSRTGTAAEIPVVPGGTTDFGAITLDPAPICLTGTLSYARCLFGPVTEPVNLYEQDPATGTSSVVSQIIPDPTGRFAAFFRRDRIYFFRREEATCNSQTAPCTSFFINPDPPAALTATDEVAPDCRDIGNVTLVCDFFGGS